MFVSGIGSEITNCNDVLKQVFLLRIPESQYKNRLKHFSQDKGIQQSMSRKGNCLNNAVMENFFGLLKSELLYLQNFDSPEHFKAELIDFLDCHNNRNRRIKLKLKGLTPAHHRYQALQVA